MQNVLEIKIQSYLEMVVRGILTIEQATKCIANIIIIDNSPPKDPSGSGDDSPQNGDTDLAPSKQELTLPWGKGGTKRSGCDY